MITIEIFQFFNKPPNNEARVMVELHYNYFTEANMRKAERSNSPDLTCKNGQINLRKFSKYLRDI